MAPGKPSPVETSARSKDYLLSSEFLLAKANKRLEALQKAREKKQSKRLAGPEECTQASLSTEVAHRFAGAKDSLARKFGDSVHEVMMGVVVCLEDGRRVSAVVSDGPTARVTNLREVMASEEVVTQAMAGPLLDDEDKVVKSIKADVSEWVGGVGRWMDAERTRIPSIHPTP